MELFPKCQHYFSDDSNSLRVASTYSATADNSLATNYQVSFDLPSIC